MIIRSHISGGRYLALAAYLKDQGKNDRTRLVEISDPAAKNLDQAFRNMWVVASHSRTQRPLHHVSINLAQAEWLSDTQLTAILERCEDIYGYKLFHHQRVVVEHFKNGKQHFHVVWNRVSLVTGKRVKIDFDWHKSMRIARDVEKEFGLQRPIPRRNTRALKNVAQEKRMRKSSGRYMDLCAPPRSPLSLSTDDPLTMLRLLGPQPEPTSRGTGESASLLVPPKVFEP